MKYAVVTGVSRGLGESVAKKFMNQGVHVVGISRNKSSNLEAYASGKKVNYTSISCDLGDMEAVNETIESLAMKLTQEKPTSIYLVNNAAAIEPIDHAMNISSSDLAYHFQVNVLAPMATTNIFLKYAHAENVPMIGLTVTSGAAEKPSYGWSAYCSSKASINMYTQTVALEQEKLATKNKVIAFSPGIMDTAMQEAIRSSSKESFAAVEKFKEYKDKNQLKNTEKVGGVLVDIMVDESKITNGKIYHVNQYL
ncbi:(S)-benzoin forming benzil reductase [Virgibacillus salexigens]|uniref:(S)-benzoin forming benzil reductase n=1 Tax=Virgibacillus massiliensis TaxID=1462526 RepID=UPI00136BAB49|nr:(S)-benzoin forming benzil reductase [Virgibacillus massiliensis]MYL42853.1 (S)-benzoin forming benzil reductase [Virgibacillus massiliensis]